MVWLLTGAVFVGFETSDANASPIGPVRALSIASVSRVAERRSAVEIGEGAETVRVVGAEVPLYQQPAVRAPRRGTLEPGAVATAYQRQRGSDCKGFWTLVGAGAWACDNGGVFERPEPRERAQAREHEAREFARIGARGTFGYTSLLQAEQQLPDAELQPGFLVGLVETRLIGGEVYARTTHDIWIAKRDLESLLPSDFEGVELEHSAIDSPHPSAQQGGVRPQSEAADSASVSRPLPVGWVYVEHATARSRIAGPLAPNAKLSRLARVRVLEVRRHQDRHTWYRTTEGWFSDRQLRVPTMGTPPEGLADGERWIDVDKSTQTLVAYVGSNPIFATLVSTGRDPESGPAATPSGSFRIWVKLKSADMDNLDQANTTAELGVVPDPYAVEAVPYVMFFRGGYGLHGTYWHDAFGTPKSHGCVNLSPRDAARLFDFASPALPSGWQAVHPYAYDTGTVVRVR